MPTVIINTVEDEESVKSSKVQKENEDNDESQVKDKADKIADQIIDAFIYKKPKTFDLDNQDDVISYEDSETRLIWMTLGLAIVFSLISIPLAIQTFKTYQVTRIQKFNIAFSTEMVDLKFPAPHVVFMDKIGKGQMISLKLNQQQQFELAWEFKVPTLPIDTGYFMFEDQSQIFVIPSILTSGITMIQSNTLQHAKLSNSQIPQKFFHFGSSVQIGRFVMVLGGYFLSADIPGTGIIGNFNGNMYCSSTKCKPHKNGNCNSENRPTTAIWSIERQVWIKGPFLPMENTCLENPSGFSLNKTHGVILTIPTKEDDMLMNCVQAFTFSVELFKWTDINSCLINLDLGFTTYTATLMNLDSATYFDEKHSHMNVIVQCHFYYPYFSETLGESEGIKLFMIKWHSHSQVVEKVSYSGGPGAMYTLRNVVYMADFRDFQNDYKVKVYTLDGESFKWKQSLEFSRRSDFISESFRMVAVPYYD